MLTSVLLDFKKFFTKFAEKDRVVVDLYLSNQRSQNGSIHQQRPRESFFGNSKIAWLYRLGRFFSSLCSVEIMEFYKYINKLLSLSIPLKWFECKKFCSNEQDFLEELELNVSIVEETNLSNTRHS